jgi:hypothetical protein
MPPALAYCAKHSAVQHLCATERRWNRTIQAWGCHALPVLKINMLVLVTGRPNRSNPWSRRPRGALKGASPQNCCANGATRIRTGRETVVCICRASPLSPSSPFQVNLDHKDAVAGTKAVPRRVFCTGFRQRYLAIQRS